jgi:hypothetical protein
MGFSADYGVYLKFRNQNEPPPNSISETPSPLKTLFHIFFELSDEKSWETPLTFSFSKVSFSGNLCFIQEININGFIVNVNKTATWSSENNGYYFMLFFELWFYNVEFETYNFHNRFVWLWLNMTS